MMCRQCQFVMVSSAVPMVRILEFKHFPFLIKSGLLYPRKILNKFVLLLLFFSC